MCKYALLMIFVFFLMVGGCGDDKPRFTEQEMAKIPLPPKTGLPDVSGGFVLAVGSDTITADEIVSPMMEHFKPLAKSVDFETFKEQVRPQVEQYLTGKISNLLLYQKAKKDAGDQVNDALDKAVETEVRKFVDGFGGDYAKAEEEIKNMGMDWKSFGEYQRKMIMSQSYIQSKLPVKKEVITYNDLLDYYNRTKDKSFLTTPAVITFRLIDIDAAKVELKDPNQNRQEQAQALADELVRRLQAGEDFGELAKQYSNDHRAAVGGLWKPVQPGSLAPPYDILAAEAMKIEPGRIAGPIGVGDHIFIMKLEDKQLEKVEPFEKVQKQMETKISFERRKAAVDEFGAKLVQQAAIAQKREFVDFCLERIYQACNR
jgi:PPIC-type PPIASE domain.